MGRPKHGRPTTTPDDQVDAKQLAHEREKLAANARRGLSPEALAIFETIEAEIRSGARRSGAR